MVERARGFEIAGNLSFMLYCEDCNKSIYDANEDNAVTRMTAVVAAQRHHALFGGEGHMARPIMLKNKMTNPNQEQ